MRIVRWVETQRQLWAEQRLNPSQLRYMTLLGAGLCSSPDLHCGSGVGFALQKMPWWLQASSRVLQGKVHVP